MNEVPDLMRIGSIPSDLLQDVETDVLDPVVFSQSFCRFTLQNKGFLHSMSRLTFALDAPAVSASNQNATYPANIGINTLIDRATLKVGGKTICEIEDWNKYMCYKSQFISNETNKERESVLTGRIINHGFSYADDSDSSATGYHLDNGTFPVGRVGGIRPISAEFLPVATSSASFVNNGGRCVFPNDNILLKNTPVFQVALSDLFPFLRFNQLPLYMMKEEVSIELVFSPKTGSSRFCIAGAGTVDATERLDITQTSVQMVADYIFYSGEMLAQYRDANPVLTWNYMDYQLSKRTYTKGASASQTKQILNVGGMGRIVNKVICGMFDDSASNTTILNTFHSQSASLNSDNVGQITTNVRYNDHYLYPIDRSLSALQFHDVTQTESNVPYITRDEYNQEGGGALGGGLSGVEYNNLDVSSTTVGLRGKFNWLAHRLNRNERINSRGIELETLYSSLQAVTNDYTMRCWIEVVRVATLENGMMDCYYA